MNCRLSSPSKSRMKGTLGPLRPLLCCSRRRRPRPLHRGSRSSARHAVGPRAGHGASLEAVAKRLLQRVLVLARRTRSRGSCAWQVNVTKKLPGMRPPWHRPECAFFFFRGRPVMKPENPLCKSYVQWKKTIAVGIRRFPFFFFFSFPLFLSFFFFQKKKERKKQIFHISRKPERERG